MFFVDGIGFGPSDPALNPLLRGDAPTLAGWMARDAVPVDARLGVVGLPQSASGQAALYSGRNAPAETGRHKEGFPGPSLKKLVRETNLFDLLQRRGYRCAFANAYYLKGPRAPWARKQSVTTVMTLQALGGVRTEAHLARAEAVYNDLTGEHLVKRGWEGSTITPARAGDILKDLAGRYDFMLFEYFLTDLVAHKGSAEEMKKVLSQIDEALAAAAAFAEGEGCLFVVISDHGNVEDASTRSHTLNPVPLVALGQGADHLKRKVKDLTDVVPALLALYPDLGSGLVTDAMEVDQLQGLAETLGHAAGSGASRSR